MMMPLMAYTQGVHKTCVKFEGIIVEIFCRLIECFVSKSKFD